MKRYILTSKQFKGKVEALYEGKGVLCRIDWAGATLTPEWVKWFKTGIPVMSEYIYSNFKETPIIVTEADFEVTFEDFKKVYPRKRNTHLAAKYWPKLTTGNQYLAYLSAIAYSRHCDLKVLAPEFIMMPETFLRKEMWKNDWDLET